MLFKTTEKISMQTLQETGFRCLEQRDYTGSERYRCAYDLTGRLLKAMPVYSIYSCTTYAAALKHSSPQAMQAVGVHVHDGDQCIASIV